MIPERYRRQQYDQEIERPSARPNPWISGEALASKLWF